MIANAGVHVEVYLKQEQGPLTSNFDDSWWITTSGATERVFELVGKHLHPPPPQLH